MFDPRRALRRFGCLWLPLLAAVALAAPVPAEPAPPPAPAESRLLTVTPGAGRTQRVAVYSAAMRADMGLTVFPARDPDAPAPVLYLLNGAAGGIDGSSWIDHADLAGFFAREQVTVVVPDGGEGSYFTDWRADDPALGRQRWATFLTAELPALIDGEFHGTGAAAVAGISMAAASVFQLAVAAPGRYRAIGSYSGCVRTSDPVGQAMVAAVVARWRGNPANMWGPFTDPAWAANDAYLQAEKLRGVALYVSAGTGAPGRFDTVEELDGNPGKLADQITLGGALEAITARCTHQLQDRLRQLDIPATFDFRPTGTHSWKYWEQDLHNSWPLFRAALNR
ncbi:alpha/beta hydrolase [Nocardia harenae]|uniref:alpha/beta hydrolase n=1 Tax=Nocardia harenae TaxID=358707 RepID=UPI000A790A22|nr:alpha/beta hydrolase family protein [Nocardia harenae]